MPDLPAYGYRVSWSEKDGECVATCVEIEGLSGLGATPARAVAQLKVAIGAWVDYLASRGLPAPPAASTRDGRHDHGPRTHRRPHDARS